MSTHAPLLSACVTWWQQPFPNANTLRLGGRQPALVDSEFVAHAHDTAARARARAGESGMVVNTHGHSDHAGDNAALQTRGAAIAAGTT